MSRDVAIQEPSGHVFRVERVDHRMGVEELERVGRDTERVVLARALALHLDDRVLVDGGRTVVF